jgi:flagella basal body P-ring formation protein FlgA
VDSQGIYLDQLVANPVGCHARLTNAPAFGSALVLSRAQVQDLAARKAPQFATTNWSGADKIRITRQSRSLGEDEALSMLTGLMQKENVHDRGQLELRFTRPWQPTTVPDEPLTLRVLEFPSTGIAPSFIVRFDLRCAQETVGTWAMPVQARLWREVLVAQTPLRRGDRLQTASLARERRDNLTLRDALSSVNQDDASLELSENIPAGSPLLAHCVRIRPVVARGKVVDAVVQEGSLTITVKAQALEDGLAGQTIRLRNAKSGHEFRGKVHNEDTIEVTL